MLFLYLVFLPEPPPGAELAFAFDAAAASFCFLSAESCFFALFFAFGDLSPMVSTAFSSRD